MRRSDWVVVAAIVFAYAVVACVLWSSTAETNDRQDRCAEMNMVYVGAPDGYCVAGIKP